MLAGGFFFAGLLIGRSRSCSVVREGNKFFSPARSLGRETFFFLLLGATETCYFQRFVGIFGCCYFSLQNGRRLGNKIFP
jgi:hypothetical protein